MNSHRQGCRSLSQRLAFPFSAIEEQQFLFDQLPSHLLRIALYKANTGCRQEEVCSLRWEWEKQMPEFGSSVFVIPGEKVKNTEERCVVLNRIARSMIEEARGMHPVYVFVRQSKHGLNTHPELSNLIAAAEKACKHVAEKVTPPPTSSLFSSKPLDVPAASRI
jgi:integrase